ncbi:Pectin lyase fold [Phytophthora cactorum]|nr:Pectin lyase fold [Phytophthora cactorum]
MGRIQFALAAALALVTKSASAFTIGTPEGIAADTTGGGNGTVVYPTTNQELITYLNSSEPLVVVLNKTFDFRGTEGTITETGCRPDYTRECMAKNNGFKSQDVILQQGGMNNTGGCTGGTEVTVTYDKAPLKRMNVKSNKTIRGIGKSGVIMGKGLTLVGDNIIVQNIHITELNRQLVWGGDAIYLQGLDHGKTTMKNIWLDHIKISRWPPIPHDEPGQYRSMTISNSDFDGNTDYSASCDGHHYWSFIFYGVTKFSMLNNYVHGTSEDNYFSNTRMPLFNKTNDGALYTVDNEDECTKYLGRACKANVLVNSGIFPSRNGETALETIKTVPTFVDYSSGSIQVSGSHQHSSPSRAAWKNTVDRTSQSSIQSSNVENVWAETTGNFGVGKLD